jgi:hypothetical protein
MKTMIILLRRRDAMVAMSAPFYITGTNDYLVFTANARLRDRSSYGFGGSYSIGLGNPASEHCNDTTSGLT